MLLDYIKLIMNWIVIFIRYNCGQMLIDLIIRWLNRGNDAIDSWLAAAAVDKGTKILPIDCRLECIIVHRSTSNW